MLSLTSGASVVARSDLSKSYKNYMRRHGLAVSTPKCFLRVSIALLVFFDRVIYPAFLQHKVQATIQEVGSAAYQSNCQRFPLRVVFEYDFFSRLLKAGDDAPKFRALI